MPALKGNRMGGNHVVTFDRCKGCGQSDVHRPDCTLEPGVLRCSAPGCSMVRLPGVKLPVWGYSPSTGYSCPEHKS